MLENAGLFDIGLASTDAQGRVYLADRGGSAVVVLGPGGQFIRSFGERGRGPGEFETIAAIDVHPDAIWILDGKLARFERYDTTGSHLGTVMLPISGATRAIGKMHDDKYWGIGPLDGVSAEGISRREVIVIDSAGSKAAILDTLRYGVQLRSSGGFHTIDPSAIRDYVIVNTGQLAVVHTPERPATDSPENDSMHIRVWSGEGTVKWQAALPIDWQPITRRDKNAHYDRILRGLPSAPLNDLKRALPFTGPQPPVTGLLLDPDGSVWLRGSSIGRDTVQWLVLTPAGQLRGRLQVPQSTEIIGVGGGSVWARERLPDGTSSLVALKLRAGTV